MRDPILTEAYALFERALDLPEAERTALLDEACRDRPELRARVETLLALDAAEETPLDADPARLWSVLVEEEDPDRREIGPYRIVRELGRGGMGVVYLAERTDPDLRQLVALKVIGSRPDAAEMAARIRRERQILARLRHPHIAQLYEGGVTPEGLPYIVMEYVEGERIDRWCDARRLSIHDRLRLFLGVCDAVHYAQRNLVVHRDLKPANILVTADGVVKLLDFGIAKVIEGDEVAPLDATRTELLAFTPHYAAPEQVRRGAISTATDVYALGVVLHELLSGGRPFPETADAFEAARMVLELDPVPPSQAVGAGGAGAAEERAAARGTTRERLRRQLKGELDAIVLKVLKKEQEERYPSAAALMDDISRHLRHEPIAARPDSAGYRLRKFVRRRRGPVAAAALVAALTTGFVTVHTERIARERDRAELEARKAQESRDFLVGLFNMNLPHRHLGEEPMASDLLEYGAVRADSLVDRPELRALLLTTIGDIFRVLGRFDRAESMIDASIAEYRALGTDTVGLADALLSKGLVYSNRGEYAAALAPIREAFALKRRYLGPEHPQLLDLLSNLATIESHTGDLDEALRMQLDLLALRRRVLGPDHGGVGVSLNNIAAIHRRAGRIDEAERYFRQALEHRRRIVPRDHPDYALSLANLGALLRERGDLDGAEPLLREAFEIRSRILSPDHPSLGVTHFQLGRLFQSQGRLDSAEVHFRATLEIDRSAYGADHPEVAYDALHLARLLVRRGDCGGARAAFDEAVRVYEGAGSSDEAALAREERANAEEVWMGSGTCRAPQVDLTPSAAAPSW